MMMIKPSLVLHYMLVEQPDLHSAVAVQIHLHHQPLETVSAIKGILTTFP